MTRAIAATALWALAIAAALIFLQACAALQAIQRPPPPGPDRNVWREWTQERERQP